MIKISATANGLIALVLLISACSGSRTVTLNSMRPAEITLPANVKTLLILDRSESEKKAVNIIESVLTGELPGEDKTGAQELLNALQSQLSYSPRFQVKIAQEKIKGNSLTSAFPDQLRWDFIDDICNKYQADAVVSLEIFDTDFIVTRGMKNIKETIGDREVQVLKYYAQGVGNITIGIRLYYPQGQTVVDQQLLRENHTWEAYGQTVQEALAQLASKNDATRFLSNAVGSDYAYKVAPMPVRITRSFRGKSRRSPELEQGTRFADVAQWQEALEIWQSGLGRARNKEAGYLSYNMAIAYEVLGDFDSALQWAEASYTRYGNKDARLYVNLIKRRLNAERRAQEQLELGYNQQD